MNYYKAGRRLQMICMFFIFSVNTFSQVDSNSIKQSLLREDVLKKAGITNSGVLKELYSLLGYEPVWVEKTGRLHLAVLLQSIKDAPDKGLIAKDYQLSYIDAFVNNRLPLQTAADSIVTELRITDAAIHYYSDLAYGNTKPAFGYNGLKNTPPCVNIPAMLADHILTGRLHLMETHLAARMPEIAIIERTIKLIYSRMAETGFNEITVKSGRVTANNTPLIQKLYQLGLISSATETVTDSALKQRVKEAQRLFSLLPDGVMRSTFLQELNMPLSARLQQLSISVNYYRWLHCLTQNQSVIVVNIPAAYLKVYKNDLPILEMRMIVGKRSTPTPTLTSMVNEVILYPYWHVPHSIAVKELLPLIKRNPGFIDAGNYQVLDRNGTVVNPYSVNWHALSAGYFPYLIRQSTGCDNALGLLKLNFYNPFGVYLHDTPGKNLFSMNKRYFSHGCMRMEKPMELGHLVLKNNAIAIDTLQQKGCLSNQAPIIVHADEHMPVIVWYNPAGVDANGRLVLYEDVYDRF